MQIIYFKSATFVSSLNIELLHIHYQILKHHNFTEHPDLIYVVALALYNFWCDTSSQESTSFLQLPLQMKISAYQSLVTCGANIQCKGSHCFSLLSDGLGCVLPHINGRAICDFKLEFLLSIHCEFIL